ITADSLLKNAKLHIREIPFTINCKTCGEFATSPAGFMTCPKCGGAETAVIAGTELNVEAIELEDGVDVP
ncbi:MAG: hydrogenase maturation nickel metallochaperone HypA, partial [Nitrospinota bacterium]